MLLRCLLTAVCGSQGHELNLPRVSSGINRNPKALRTHTLRLLGPKTIIYDPGSAVPPPPSPPQWFLPTPPPCGVVWRWVASPPPVVWCGVVVGCFPPPSGVVWFGCGLWWFPPFPPVAWCGLGGSPLHVWICLGCLANPCS